MHYQATSAATAVRLPYEISTEEFIQSATLKRKSNVILPVDVYGRPDFGAAVYDVFLDGRCVDSVTVDFGRTARALERMHMQIVRRMVIEERRGQITGAAVLAGRRVPSAIAARALTWCDKQLSSSIALAMAGQSRTRCVQRVYSVNEVSSPGFYEIFLQLPSLSLLIRDRFGAQSVMPVKRASFERLHAACTDILRSWGFREEQEAVLPEERIRALRVDPPQMSYAAIDMLERAMRTLRAIRDELDVAAKCQAREVAQLHCQEAAPTDPVRKQLIYNTGHQGGRVERTKARAAKAYAQACADVHAFKDLAEQCCVDAEALIASRGGIPDLTNHFVLARA